MQVVHFLICEITGPPRLEGYRSKLMSEGIIHMCMESLNQHIYFPNVLLLAEHAPILAPKAKTSKSGKEPGRVAKQRAQPLASNGKHGTRV